MEEKVNLRIIKMNPSVSNGMPQPYLDPKLKYNVINDDNMQ
jgi:hypothetical protein